MKCYTCGTEFLAYPCPTCEQKRLNEERNRLLKEQKQATDRQTAEIEEQNRLMREEREMEKDERDIRIKQDKFDERLEELNQYAVERKLIPVYVYFDKFKNDFYLSGNFDKELEEFLKSENLSHEIFLSNDVFEQKCLSDFYALEKSLTSDDRLINAGEYYMAFTPKFKLSEVKQAVRNNSSDYVILPYDDKTAIFPIDLVTNNDKLTGYEGKTVEIGSFNYLMYLKNKEEMNNVANILSISRKNLETGKKKIENAVRNFFAVNKKPELEEEAKEKKYYGNFIAVILGIIIGCIPGIFFLDFIGIYSFADLIKEGWVLLIVVAFILFLGLFGCIKIGLKIAEAIGWNIHSKNVEKRDKVRKEHKQDISQWKESFGNTISQAIKNLDFN